MILLKACYGIFPLNLVISWVWVMVSCFLTSMHRYVAQKTRPGSLSSPGCQVKSAVKRSPRNQHKVAKKAIGYNA